MNVRSLLACALLALSACAPHIIPGTQIPDTEDSHAILDVMERFRAALEARDAKGIQALVSKSFHDNAGTEDLQDDLTVANLPQALADLFAHMEAPRVEMDVRSVTMKADGVANVIYFWNSNWRAPGLLEKTQRDAELEQMVLQKEEGHWRIVSGL